MPTKRIAVSTVVAVVLLAALVPAAGAADVLRQDVQLQGTAFVAGDTIRATLTLSNPTARSITIAEGGGVTLRPPGRAHTDGPWRGSFEPHVMPKPFVFAPLDSQTFDVSYTLPADSPPGTWEVYPTYREAGKKDWDDGPSQWITVGPAPAGFLTAVGLQLDAAEYAPGDTMHANVTFANQSAMPVTLDRGLITARPPGAPRTAGPFGAGFTPELSTRTISPGSSVSIDAAAYKLPARSTEGTWDVYATYHDADGWHDGASVPVEVRTPADADAPGKPDTSSSTTTGQENVGGKGKTLRWRMFYGYRAAAAGGRTRITRLRVVLRGDLRSARVVVDCEGSGRSGRGRRTGCPFAHRTFSPDAPAHAVNMKRPFRRALAPGTAVTITIFDGDRPMGRSVRLLMRAGKPPKETQLRPSGG